MQFNGGVIDHFCFCKCTLRRQIKWILTKSQVKYWKDLSFGKFLKAVCSRPCITWHGSMASGDVLTLGDAALAKYLCVVFCLRAWKWLLSSAAQRPLAHGIHFCPSLLIAVPESSLIFNTDALYAMQENDVSQADDPSRSAGCSESASCPCAGSSAHKPQVSIASLVCGFTPVAHTRSKSEMDVPVYFLWYNSFILRRVSCSLEHCEWL